MASKESRYESPILQRYEVALDEFEQALDDFSTIYEELDSFKPMLEHIEDLRGIIENSHELLEDYDDDEADFDELEEELKHQTCESLQEVLDCPPNILRTVKITQNDPEIEKVLDDLGELVDRYYEENIRDKGYSLYHTLIGAK